MNALAEQSMLRNLQGMMDDNGFKWAIGLMSGTSLDGVDAALIYSDARHIAAFGPSITRPYDKAFRERIRGILGARERSAAIDRLEEELTMYHCDAVDSLLAQTKMTPGEIELIGFHGQTILHDPDNGRSWQLGDGALLAGKTGIPVVYNFRANDVACGGEGAPLAPIYHQALTSGMEKPVAVLNIGGVANVTVIDEESNLLAFDTGPGNALLDDFMLQRKSESMDQDGAAAAAGQIDDRQVAAFLEHDFFHRRPPKSLDRDAFAGLDLQFFETQDGAATLTAMTVAAVAKSLDHMPVRPRRWLICGGGRRNPVMMAGLARALGVPVDAVETVGWDGDALEAQAFAFLGLRHIKALPISFPMTTRAPFSLDGGVMVLPQGLSD